MRPSLHLVCLSLAACAARPPLPSLVVGVRESRSSDARAAIVDRSVTVALVATERPPTRFPVPTPPAVARAPSAACDAGWLCAWERTRVAEATARLAEAGR